MATSITHDSQSFLVDGHRVWIVSGLIDYFRVPKDSWDDRLRMAVEAGLNTICVRCPWAMHEPRRGEFRFTDDADIAEFIELIIKHGLRCILRIGPYIGHDLDLGGMPSWLLADENVRLREGNSAFLESASRYFGKLLKVLSPFSGIKGGPIILVQVEHEWFCGNNAAAQSYLLEIARFIREHDFDVPMINTNSLWQHREETIDTWCGRDEMLMYLRQLRSIHPSKPLMVGDFWTGEIDTWYNDRPTPPTPATLMHKLAQVAASGAQFNLSPFHGGTNFGFTSSRLPGALDSFSTTSADSQAPLTETGKPGESYHLLRRLCTFVSSFSRVFSAVDPSVVSTVPAVEPPIDRKKSAKSGFSVVHSQGAQGDVLFVFADPDKTEQSTNILLPNGQRLPIEFDSQPVVWCLLDVHLGGRSRLDWTNLNVLTMAGRSVLVCYGVAGQTGLISINHSLLEITVPHSQTPLVEEHEDITLVICNGESIDTTYVQGSTVHVGIDGFDLSGELLPAPGWRYRFAISAGGEVVKKANAAELTTSSTVRLGSWSAANIDEYIDGTAPRYATIDGPSTQEECSAGSGYGLLRIQLPKGSGKKTTYMFPNAGDRLHMYIDGELTHLFGYGPNASDDLVKMSLPSDSESTLVMLVDNLGRYGGGNNMDEGKGLTTGIHEIAPIKIGRPEIVAMRPVSPFDLRSYIEGLHHNDMTSGHELSWKFKYLRLSPLILEIRDTLTPTLVILNDEPIAYYAGHTGCPKMQLLLDNDVVHRGNNEIRLAPMVHPDETDLADSVKLYQSVQCITQDATWSFAKWEQPKDRFFKPMNKTAMKSLIGRPIWFRAKFRGVEVPRDEALWLDATGLSKGQIFLNGRNLCRYFNAPESGKAVGPQKRYYLPGSWINTDEPNEIVLFDEHGRDPGRVRLVFADGAF